MATLWNRCRLFHFPQRRVKSSSRYTASAASYCVNLVRQYDFENYLCCLLANKQNRHFLFAIRAFNVEIARICDSSTVVSIGKMKMQFWKDTIDSIYTKKKCPDHPVAMELLKVLNSHGDRAVQKHNMSKLWFTRLLDAREEYLHNNPFVDTEELENYSEKIVSSILYLTLEGVGVKDTNADHCASHLGKAIGIATLLRSTLHHANKSRNVLWPTDVLLQHGLSQEDVLRRKNLPAVKEATYQLASLAHIHLDKARSLSGNVPRAGFRVFLPAVSCNSYLKSLQDADFDIFNSKLYERNNLLPLSLLKALWRSTF